MATYEDFQQYKQRLADGVGYKLYNILQDCHNRYASLGFDSLLQDVEKINQKLRSHRFRIAIIGEFSRGKSTLVNALVGEKIQPVRAIACSGTITVLRHGKEKRVICYYKDGRLQDVPLEKYQDLVKISKEAARKYLSDELSRSPIEEVIFEHPNLELCRHGVEIVDSPGLNEHSERERITRKLIQDADAVIFLLLASQILTRSERELLQDVRQQLCRGKKNEAARNLFLVINKIDELDSEEDRQDVRDGVEEFAFGENLIPQLRDRIHYISTQYALISLLDRNEDEYLEGFKRFIQSLESFLTSERGTLTFKVSVDALQSTIQKTSEGLYQAENILDGKILESERVKRKILEEIGDASGRSVKIINLAEKLTDEVLDKAIDSFNDWYKNLSQSIYEKSEKWISKYAHIWSQDKLIEDYTNQFIRDLQSEMKSWEKNQLSGEILEPNLKILARNIREELDSIQYNSAFLDEKINSNFSQQAKLKIHGITGNISGPGGFMGGIGAGGALAFGLLAFAGIGLIPIIVAAVATAIASSFGLGLIDIDGIHKKIKQKIIEQGFKKLDQSRNQIEERLHEIVISAFDNKRKGAEDAIAQVISCYEQFLEQQAKVLDEKLEQRKADKAVILQKRQELNRVRQELETVLSQLPR